MVNYENGKIYRIICNVTGKQYIGATTTTLSARLSQHKKLFSTNKTCLSREVIEAGDYAIYLIEDCPCERKEQLLSRERYFIETTDCVNKKIPLRTKYEWYMDNRDEVIRKQLLWNMQNPDKTKIYKQTYNVKNKPIKNENIKLNVSDTLSLDEEYRNFVINQNFVLNTDTPTDTPDILPDI
jgi:hypothetical protein